MSFLPTDLPSFLWGAGVAALAAFGSGFLTKLGEAAAEHLKGKIAAKPSTHDQALFAEFLRDFATEPTLRLFKCPDFDASFRRTDLEPLNTFVGTWDSVEKEFMDSKLEEAKKKPHASATSLSNEIAMRTVPVGDGTLASVYSDSVRRETGADERPEWVREDAKTLNACVKPFALEYEAFVRLCRERLKQ